jgi:hypothetical protein
MSTTEHCELTIVPDRILERWSLPSSKSVVLLVSPAGLSTVGVQQVTTGEVIHRTAYQLQAMTASIVARRSMIEKYTH